MQPKPKYQAEESGSDSIVYAIVTLFVVAVISVLTIIIKVAYVFLSK